MDRPDTEDLALRIKEYLSSHHHAADSATGIVKWWLAGEEGLYTSEAVELALKQLIKRGVVKKTINVDGTVMYERAEGVDPSGSSWRGS